MTTPIERAGTRKRVTWLTLVGVILLPVLIGGILVAALWNPTDNLDGIRAAVVNEDVPVTVNGQLAPLGRQLTAGLVEGSKEVDSNIDWVISNADDAATGLADGTYQATITIPKNFSAAATSTAGTDPEKAHISVTTAPEARVFDAAITNQIAAIATTTMGQKLSSVYLENVLLGFTSLNEKLGTAATGAHELASGSDTSAAGAKALADGVGQTNEGAQNLAAGADKLAAGLAQLAPGAQGVATGVSSLADSTTDLAGGAHQLADGLGRMNSQVGQAGAGLQQLIDAIDSALAEFQRSGALPEELLNAAAAAASGSADVAGAIGDAAGRAGTVAQSAGTLAADCASSGASAEYCQRVAAVGGEVGGIASDLGGVASHAGSVATDAGTAKAYLDRVGPELSAKIAAVLTQIRDGLTQAKTGIDQFTTGVDQLSGASTQLAGGLDRLAAGTSDLAGGATQVSDGLAASSAGAGELSSGTSRLADGTSALTDGAGRLSGGLSSLAKGTTSLADGLTQAVAQIPTYTDAEAKSLASVVSDPVTTKGSALTEAFGGTAIPLLAIVALWFGGLATFVAIRARTRRTLASRAPSALLALRTLLPGAVIGVIQGVLVAIVVQIAARYDLGTFVSFTALAALVGVTFAAVHQALIAVFGGTGRWIAAVVGVLFFATGVISTTPTFLTAVAGVLPTAGPFHALSAAVTSAGGLGGAIAVMLVWLILALGATTLAVARRRSTSARALRLRTSPA
ncbi:YhgE/Pip domain-containing protein [Microbacterium gorillae]|uniref:YhgE/Pip domain-containing protein n=1 Tax=Microbacterium gorillae TaxID=1231063 RepID=UPI00058C33CD|nr:YhgE/Pip domain-containing protein [Microbacterium gorillae]